jgi:hypothetical protein
VLHAPPGACTGPGAANAADGAATAQAIEATVATTTVSRAANARRTISDLQI